jgi:hypothetical protein
VIASTDPAATHPVWRNTTVPSAGLNVPELIGMEGDEMAPQQPSAQQSILAQTIVNIDGIRSDDNGQSYSTSGNMTWGIVSQRYASGAVVVGFGTCTWSWGLDNTHDIQGASTGNRANAACQQMMLNLLVDLGAASPASLVAGMTSPSPVALSSYGVLPAGSSVPANIYVRRNGAWQQLDVAHTLARRVNGAWQQLNVS